MPSCTNAAYDLASTINSGSSVSTASTSTPLTQGQLFSFFYRNRVPSNQQLPECTLTTFEPLEAPSAGFPLLEDSTIVAQ